MKKIILSSLAISFMAISFAATQGTLGPTSTGTTTITLTIPQLVRISNLQDITLTPSTIPVTGVNGNTPACIYSNNSGNYAVTVTGSGAGGAFTVANGPTTVAYTATWNDNTTTSNLTAGVKLAGQTGASTTSVTCANSGGMNSTFAINFSQTALAAAPPGTSYTGVATILISPS